MEVERHPPCDTAHSQGSLGLLPSVPGAFTEGPELWSLREGLFILKQLPLPDPSAWQGPSWDAVGGQPASRARGLRLQVTLACGRDWTAAF